MQAVMPRHGLWLLMVMLICRAVLLMIIWWRLMWFDEDYSLAGQMAKKLAHTITPSAKRLNISTTRMLGFPLN
jgi:hypothetical protein